MNRPNASQRMSVDGRSALGWDVLRVTVALLIAAHGWVRFLGGGIAPFGEWLTSQGLPLGFALAAGITAFEVVGTVALALRKGVVALTISFALLYAIGIAMVHAQEGWFVVGRGRNGAEYSVLLIAVLLCVGLQHVRAPPPR